MTSPFATTDLNNKAVAIVYQLAQGCRSEAGIGSFSSVAYESAWVSMIQKKEDGTRPLWRFPECYQYLLDSQCPDGGWNESPRASEVDSILNALAALLALKRHEHEPLNCENPIDLNTRISSATSFLRTRLVEWDVEASDHVGFEILIPALLQLLERERVTFFIPRLHTLQLLNQKKLAGFDPRLIYAKGQKLTLIHSLESFVNTLDFDKVGHHKISGSMMGSPASTAAYLMNSSIWDEESEAYLCRVIAAGSGKGSGGLPSAYPTPIFELTWVLSTLLLSGFTVGALGSNNIEAIGDYLEYHYNVQHGLLGFAPEILADADDTAKTILSLSLIGRSVSPTHMIAEFENELHFKTYTRERNPSFSANCNVMTALLYSPEPYLYIDQLAKAAYFLCNSWWKGSIKDKWNASLQYPMMLLSQALVQLLRLWDNGSLAELPHTLVKDLIPVVLFQMLVRTLRAQTLEGSWGNQSQEITSYAILTLTYLQPLPWAGELLTETRAAITSGRQYLSQYPERWTESDCIWTEKVSYGSSTLCHTYCLAAMNVSTDTTPWGEAVQHLTSIPYSSLGSFVYFFFKLPMFAAESKWMLLASLVEGYLFLPRLKLLSRSIFSRENMADDKYLEYIPFTWVASNHLQLSPISSNILLEMMIISMLNYQADEYMEAVVGKHFENNLEPISDLIHSLCELPAPTVNGSANEALSTAKISRTNGTKQACPDVSPLSNNESPSLLSSVAQTLRLFTDYILCHPRVVLASRADRTQLRQLLRTFLLAHLTHISDNSRLSSQSDWHTERTTPFQTASTPYFDWVHTTSAQHTSCPYSFAFITCLIGATHGNDCFPGARAKYFAADMCGHLAVMCRMYNDYGSVDRDRAEQNLNSINFPDFHDGEALPLETDTARRSREESLKATLFELAEYERGCMERPMVALKALVKKGTMDIVQLFVAVTDLYGQIYVARDIASRMK